MSILSYLAVYFITWAICLFVVLPFGIHTQSDANEVVKGTEPGAPASLNIVRKLLITSILALVITTLVLWAISNPSLRAYWR